MCGPTTGRPSSSTFGFLSFCWPRRPSLASLPALSRSRSSSSSRFLGTHISRSWSAIVANMRRYFPYFITVGSLTVLFVIGIFWLIAQRRLLPAIVMIGAFMFFVLWLVGLVIVGIQLFGPDGSIQSVCDVQVFGRNPTGQTERTMAWLQQRNICTCSILSRSMRTGLTNCRPMLAVGICHVADWNRLLHLGHDHGLPGVCQLIGRAQHPRRTSRVRPFWLTITMHGLRGTGVNLMI